MRIRERWGAVRAGGERGASMTGMVMVFSFALIIVIGLTVDGGAQVKAMTRAERVATEAARAGLQGSDLSGELNAAAATAAAQRYLAVADTDGSLSGTVEVDADLVLQVQVQIDQRTAVLSVVGVNSLTARGSGSAQLVRGLGDGD